MEHQFVQEFPVHSDACPAARNDIANFKNTMDITCIQIMEKIIYNVDENGWEMC
jgi:hypothetical protein